MQLVSASEAARQLGVHPSQVTRGIQSGVIPNRAPPGFDRPMVNVDEARQARSEWLDRSKQRGPRSPLFVAEGGREAATAQVPVADPGRPPAARQAATGSQGGVTPYVGVLGAVRPPQGLVASQGGVGDTAGIEAPGANAEGGAGDDDVRDPSYQASRARRESALAEKAQIELAQLRGQTLDRAEVADVAFRLGQMLREGMETRQVALAQRLVGLELAAMIGVLADADDAHLAALADAIARDLAPAESAVAA